MKIKLYPCFNHWLQHDNIWILSDPHFNDPEMKYFRKDYIGDAEFVKRINSKVGKKDIFICLGDCGDLEFIKKIRGYKVLIKGNHDDKGDDYYKRVVEYDYNCHCETGAVLSKKLISDNHLFDEVYPGGLWISEKVLLSHQRIDLPFVYNIYGHHHGDPINNDHLKCVCAEFINYTPLSLLDMYKHGTFSKVESIHRQTIDNAIERKLKKNNKSGQI